jgi:hypothetical protein
MSYEREIFLDSSFLKEARYSDNHLTIYFVSGAVIDYEAPREVFDTMCLAESPGKFYHECIKGKYESTKL